MARRWPEIAIALPGGALALASLVLRAGISGANEGVCWSQDTSCAISLAAALVALLGAAAVIFPRFGRWRRSSSRVWVAVSILVLALALVSLIALATCDPPRNLECTDPGGVAASLLRRL